MARLLFRWLAQFVADASATLVRARGGGGHLAAGGRRSERRRQRRQRRRPANGGGAADGAADGGASGGAEPSSALDWPGGWLLGALCGWRWRCDARVGSARPSRRARAALLIKRATHAALEERADERSPSSARSPTSSSDDRRRSSSRRRPALEARLVRHRAHHLGLPTLRRARRRRRRARRRRLAARLARGGDGDEVRDHGGPSARRLPPLWSPSASRSARRSSSS